jgi:putative ABC transport system ATP-binding protein
MSAEQAKIVATGLTRVYGEGTAKVHALRGLDLEIHAGEFTALVGPSGSGKSTLLNVLGCLDRPTDGRVWIDGTDVTGLNKTAGAAFRLQKVGFVFQAYNLLPVLTVYENAEYTMMLQGASKAKRAERVEELLSRVGLTGLEDRRPHELSGGQQQRVAVVRAVAPGPAIILADEPTANLDSETSSDLLDLMLQLNRDDGITFVFASHDTQVMSRARRVLHLVDGSISEETRRDDP